MRSILRSSILASIALWLLSPALSLADRPNIVLRQAQYCAYPGR